jgi:hypothetical protein
MRLQPVGLTEADVTRLEVFLRFIGKRARGQWVLVRDGAADLLICAADARRFVPNDPPPEVAVLSGSEAPTTARTGEIALPHALDLDAFQELLDTVELRLGVAASAPVAAARASPTPLPPDHRPGVPATTTTPSGPAAFATSAPPAKSSAPATPALLEGRFRLIRWPGAELLRSHPKAMRLLGFLAREAITLEHLETLSGLDRSTCAEVLRQLLRRELLAWHGASAGAPARPSSARTPTTAQGNPRVMPAPELARGLLNRLRARLGLS